MKFRFTLTHAVYASHRVCSLGKYREKAHCRLSFLSAACVLMEIIPISLYEMNPTMFTAFELKTGLFREQFKKTIDAIATGNRTNK